MRWISAYQRLVSCHTAYAIPSGHFILSTDGDSTVLRRHIPGVGGLQACEIALCTKHNVLAGKQKLQHPMQDPGDCSCPTHQTCG